MINPIVLLALQELPRVIDLFKAKHAEANPDALPLTDAEVIAAFQAACDSTLAKDALYLSIHKENRP